MSKHKGFYKLTDMIQYYSLNQPQTVTLRNENLFFKHNRHSISEKVCNIKETQVNFRAHNFGLINIKPSKKSDNICFTGAYINPKDLKIIKSVMERCHYMVDVKHMITSDKFKVIPYKNAVLIQDYYSSDAGEKEIYGTCAGLSYKVAQKLKEQLGDKYKILAVSGIHEFYSMIHYCVAICKKDPAKNFNNIDCLTNNTIIIDPSFGLVGSKNDRMFKDYRFEKIENLNHKEYSDLYLFYDEWLGPDSGLLGQVKLLAPGIFDEVKTLDKDALIRFEFGEPRDPNTPNITFTTHDNNGISYLNLSKSVLQKCLSPNDLLKQWIDKVEKALQPPVNENFSPFH